MSEGVQRHLLMVAPHLFDADDPRYADEGERAWALDVAAAWRPLCLPAPQQDLAQAYRAAFELGAIQRMRIAAGATQTIGVAGAVVRRKEGDVETQYSEGKVAAVSTTGGDTGPGTPYALWKELWSLCIVGGTDGGGNPIQPPRRGHILAGTKRFC